MKVFRMSDFEWYAANSLAEAVALCVADCGLPAEEACDKPRECTPEEMGRLTYKHDPYSMDGATFTFSEELARRVAAGAKPGFFATTEY